MKCDELKVYHCNEWHNEHTEFYLKYDVDASIDELKSAHHKESHEYINMIAELKEKHKTEVKELLCLIRNKSNNFNRAFDSEEKELRHHKYKRCLDKAKLCESEEKRLEAIAPIFDTDKECWEYNSDYWYKWRERWLELAEQFKEAK